jgi:hypothetical protein
LEDGAGVFLEDWLGTDRVGGDRVLVFFLDLGTSVHPSEGDGAGRGKGLCLGPVPEAAASRYEGRLGVGSTGGTGGADVVEEALVDGGPQGFDFDAKLGDLVLVLLLRPRTLGRRSRQGMSGERRGIVHHSCKKTRRRQATDQLIN